MRFAGGGVSAKENEREEYSEGGNGEEELVQLGG